MMRIRTAAVVGAVVLLGLMVAIAVAPGAVSADDGANNDTDVEACEADIDNFDLHTADDTVEGADDPARVGVSASTSVTNECPVVVQVTFDIPNNMYYQGTSADASGQGLQTEVFEVEPGDMASFTTEMYATQEGEHSVVADVEYFPEGQPDEARSLDNMMLEFTVEEAVDEEDLPESEEADSDTEESEDQENDEDVTPPPDNGNPILGFLDENLEVIGLITLGLAGVIGLVKREPILNVFTR